MLILHLVTTLDSPHQGIYIFGCHVQVNTLSKPSPNTQSTPCVSQWFYVTVYCTSQCTQVCSYKGIQRISKGNRGATLWPKTPCSGTFTENQESTWWPIAFTRSQCPCCMYWRYSFCLPKCGIRQFHLMFECGKFVARWRRTTSVCLYWSRLRRIIHRVGTECKNFTKKEIETAWNLPLYLIDVVLNFKPSRIQYIHC